MPNLFLQALAFAYIAESHPEFQHPAVVHRTGMNCHRNDRTVFAQQWPFSNRLGLPGKGSANIAIDYFDSNGDDVVQRKARDFGAAVANHLQEQTTGIKYLLGRRVDETKSVRSLFWNCRVARFVTGSGSLCPFLDCNALLSSGHKVSNENDGIYR